MKKTRLVAIANIATIFSFTLAGCQNNQSSPKPKVRNQVAVTYTLNENKKNIEKKVIKVPKKSTVMTGLKKAWKVSSHEGFITAIDGKKQNPKQKIYWTYTINGKYATKGATQQKVANNDKIKFTLAKMK